MITLNSPFDAHLHLREGEMLELVASLSNSFSGAIIMPNIKERINSIYRLIKYREQILKNTSDFAPYMTIYFQPDYTLQDLTCFKDFGILGIKFYPKGLTHNSEAGCDVNDSRIQKILDYMQALEIPLLVHGEAPGEPFEREYNFTFVAEKWATKFPNLKIILEHISDHRTIELLYTYKNIYATVTPHHLLMTCEDWISNPHHNCMPIIKNLRDRNGLRYLVLKNKSIFEKVMLGTDSAPHHIVTKHSRKISPGIFNAPIALQLLAPLFESDHDRFQAFVSDNARKIYNLSLPEKQVKLIKKPFTIPEIYDYVIPMLANETIDWSIE